MPDVLWIKHSEKRPIAYTTVECQHLSLWLSASLSPDHK